VRIVSDLPFAFSTDWRSDPIAEVALLDASGARRFERPRSVPPDGCGWFVSETADDGQLYLRWGELYEFTVDPAGTRVMCRPLPNGTLHVLQNFLFAQVLSFALVRQGFEPLHAAVVDVDGAAVGLLGDCTFGKSTLAATFVRGGCRLLTDDMLMVHPSAGSLLAMPGSGRIKLHADSAATLLPALGNGLPLNPRSAKRAFPLSNDRTQRAALPLAHLFVLPTPAERDAARGFGVEPMTRSEAARALLSNSFNVEIVDRRRLARQFAFATGLAEAVPCSKLRYPSGFEHLETVRRMLAAHVSEPVCH